VSFLAKIEAVCATFIERTFAKSFPSDLEPAQIARKLVSTMEAQTHGEEGRLRAPGSYAVYVSPEDFERLADRAGYLERAWAQLLRDLAARVGIAFEDGSARVEMAARAGVPPGAIAIEVGSAVIPSGAPKTRSNVILTEGSEVEGRRTKGAARFSLRMVKGVPPDGVYPIEGQVRIGRNEESEIVLVDPSVSRAHAILEVNAGEPVVRDLGSTNGTFVNGKRVRAHRLRDGDELLFGNTKMRIESP
jgi:FHA domain/FhaA, N-terminal domain